MTKGNRLSERKGNIWRRDDFFYFHYYSIQICITDQVKGGQYDWIYGQIPAARPYALMLASLTFKNLSEVDL